MLLEPRWCCSQWGSDGWRDRPRPLTLAGRAARADRRSSISRTSCWSWPLRRSRLGSKVTTAGRAIWSIFSWVKLQHHEDEPTVSERVNADFWTVPTLSSDRAAKPSHSAAPLHFDGSIIWCADSIYSFFSRLSVQRVVFIILDVCAFVSFVQSLLSFLGNILWLNTWDVKEIERKLLFHYFIILLSLLLFYVLTSIWQVLILKSVFRQTLMKRKLISHCEPDVAELWGQMWQQQIW